MDYSYKKPNYIDYVYKISEEFDCFIFDWDDTLVRSREQCFKAFKDTLSEITGGRDNISKERFREYDKVGYKHKNIYLDYKIDKKGQDMFLSKFMENCVESLEFTEGSLDILKHLKKTGKKIAVATNGYISNIIKIASRYKVLELFDIITGIDDSLNPKPSPDMLNHIINALNVNKEKTVMIGDRDVDIIAAHAAGVFSAAITSGPIDNKWLIKEKPEIIAYSVKTLFEGDYEVIAYRKTETV